MTSSFFSDLLTSSPQAVSPRPPSQVHKSICKKGEEGFVMSVRGSHQKKSASYACTCSICKSEEEGFDIGEESEKSASYACTYSICKGGEEGFKLAIRGSHQKDSASYVCTCSICKSGDAGF